MDDIAAADPLLVFVSESQQGGCGITVAGFNFNRVHLVFRFTVI